MSVRKKHWLPFGLAALLAVPASAFDTTAASSALDSAVGYLDNRQHQSDGGWGESDGLRYVSTAAAVDALYAANRRGGSYYSGIAWLENHSARNTDGQARKVAVLSPHGNNIFPDLQDIQAAKRNSSQGGWGLSGGYVASPLESALVLPALSLNGNSTEIDQLLVYLVQAQLGDGGWSTAEAGVSDFWVTAEVLLALLPYKDRPEVSIILNPAASYLSSIDSTASAQVLARTALALYEYQGMTTAVDTLVSSLLLRQAADGGWGSDLATASNLRLLASLLDLDGIAGSGNASIEEENLRLAINEALGGRGYAPISRGDLGRLTRLDLRQRNIDNLNGLEWATNLTEVWVDPGTDVSALAELADVEVKFDRDMDDVADSKDNCPSNANADQADLDKDGFGDACDTDIDGDGLTNAQELAHGTNPRLVDTDGDQIPDGYEVNHGLNPRVNDASRDKDGDLLTNLEEHQLGLDASNVDSDDDGMDDGFEVAYGLNPLLDDAAEDLDGDGATNLEEYQARTDPTDPNSNPHNLIAVLIAIITML